MSIMFADDFKGYGTSTDRMKDGLYAEVQQSNLHEDPDPNATGIIYNAVLNASNGGRLRRVFSQAVTTAGFAFRLWLNSLPGNDSQTLSHGFLPNNTSYEDNPFLQVDGTGRIVVRKGHGTAGVELGRTTNPVLTANGWHHIEMKCVADLVNGTVEVRVDGVPVLTCMGVNTGTQYSQFAISCPNSIGVFNDWSYKDFVVWNGLGGQNTSFLGTVSVVGLTPDSDVSLGWTPSLGTTGWDLINESPPQDATDYIVAPFPLPPPSTFGLTNLPVNVSSVRALITQVRARKADGGDGNIQTSLLSNGDTANGADRPTTTAFLYYEDVFETDPHTAAPWLPGAVDAATLKLNRTL